MIAEIEKEILSKLKSISQFKSVDIAQGDAISILQDTVNQRPACRVVFAGSEAQPPLVINSNLTEITLNYIVFVVSKRGKNSGDDVYKLLELIRDVLQRQTIKDYGYLCLRGETLAHIQDGVAVYGCEYYITVSYQ